MVWLYSLFCVLNNIYVVNSNTERYCSLIHVINVNVVQFDRICAFTSFSCLQVWIFGDLWCKMWLALDVWMCTASILNLCAISLDRYVAVTRPISYPSIMSPSRAKMLIAGLWVLSFVICFPPLVGWRDSKVSVQLLFFLRTILGLLCA